MPSPLPHVPRRCTALQYEGKYSDGYPAATYVYASANFLDDLAFAVSGAG